MNRKKALKRIRKALDFCNRNEYLSAKHYERSSKALKFLEGKEVGRGAAELRAAPALRPHIGQDGQTGIHLDHPNELQSLVEWAAKDLFMRTEETIKALIPKEIHHSTEECGNLSLIHI